MTFHQRAKGREITLDTLPDQLMIIIGILLFDMAFHRNFFTVPLSDNEQEITNGELWYVILFPDHLRSF